MYRADKIRKKPDFARASIAAYRGTANVFCFNEQAYKWKIFLNSSFQPNTVGYILEGESVSFRV